ncbi:lipopolysaccharide cholinephosphotransferase LicD1 [Floricoccus tropicus]|uniref:Lipopolysaccharide cholinephosphotransferase LicD1 n=1 Tax=Floricoccus tropicus TaxID=1859473 RepID=A0A1E8GKK7_9LACT|nr:LicD family protein [Floricoccus tropicus]OFI48727.1 lipopolysaccharide cholinephosphotransferase LicD1 [Floricoccus tropicus]
MKKMTIEEIRKIQLDMLSYIDSIARENNIEYSLGGGSLLGSIRHKGFIPWDDDIDIMLYRSDYNKLIEELKKSQDDRYSLLHYSTEKNLLSFAKLYDNSTQFISKTDKMHPWTGLFIDIFPMDRLPENEHERLSFMKSVQNNAENLLSTSFPAYASGSKAIYAFARLFLRFPRFVVYHGKWTERAEILDQLMQKYDNQDVPYIGFTDSRYRAKEFFPKEIFEEYEDIMFEDVKARKIQDHDRYLKQLYGDSYMELPPENKRENHSYYTWYWKD